MEACGNHVSAMWWSFVFRPGQFMACLPDSEYPQHSRKQPRALLAADVGSGACLWPPSRTIAQYDKHKFARHTRTATQCQDRIMTCLPTCEPIIRYRLLHVLLQHATPHAPYSCRLLLACVWRHMLQASKSSLVCLRKRASRHAQPMHAYVPLYAIPPFSPAPPPQRPPLARNTCLRQPQIAFHRGRTPFPYPCHQIDVPRPNPRALAVGLCQRRPWSTMLAHL